MLYSDYSTRLNGVHNLFMVTDMIIFNVISILQAFFFSPCL